MPSSVVDLEQQFRQVQEQLELLESHLQRLADDRRNLLQQQRLMEQTVEQLRQQNRRLSRENADRAARIRRIQEIKRCLQQARAHLDRCLLLQDSDTPHQPA
ncbi:MAG: hypothetical protein RMK52_02580 [Chitinophagales bacterium]|nr:hypothetical protein [Chitinophagales bacterium]MDW8393110.1 hypothetical protein [Chitinophagales bacterium]